MNVGLPGTGIGGMFYLLSALCMPLVEALRSMRNRKWRRWRLVGAQAIMALGMVAGIWVTGWLLALVLAASPQALAALRGAGVGSRAAPNVLRAASLVMSLGTLGLVITSVWIAKLWIHGWGAGSREAGATNLGGVAERPSGARAGHGVPEFDAA